MNEVKQKLVLAEQKAKAVFDAVESQGLIVAGKSERVLTEEVATIAKSHFGIDQYWHKKIVRVGINTLQPFSGNPPDVTIQQDDIVFLDFGFVFQGYEADLGRTYVVGKNPLKLKLKNDLVAAWNEAEAWYLKQTKLTGAQYFHYIVDLTKRYGYEFGNEIAGHIVGPFPHEQLGDGNLGLDVHPDNHADILGRDPQGNPRHWILEIHFVDRKNNIGGFFEQLLNTTHN
jgi:Xaa-Pro aminopeptidase